jgi:hypothetical protein
MKFAEIRALCMALPEAEERETWGEVTFRVRDKIFVMGSPDGEAVSVKASLDDHLRGPHEVEDFVGIKAGLVEMDPEIFSVSAYTGRFGWVNVQLAAVDAELARRLVVNAWRRSAPKRLAATLAELTPPSRPAPRAPRRGRG